jgi:hypothetical protein
MISMSFRYGQFGTGFKLTRPPVTALRFEELVKTRGRAITIIGLEETGEDSYGQPVYQESSHEEKAFVEARGGERIIPPGTVKEGKVMAFLVPWAAVKEEGYEVEIDGVRYHIDALVETDAYMELNLERKAS